SKLHGEVSREMWKDLWVDVPTDEVAITSITNGVHTETWMSREFRNLYNEYMEDKWLEKVDDQAMWEDIDVIPSTRLWETHLHRKGRLSDIVKSRLEERNKRNGVAPHLTKTMCQYLKPDTLFIGFARRFATYKRANLIFRDIERLKILLSNPNQPVVFFFAGKAHPADRPGQEFIKEIYRLSYTEDFIGKIILLENYNMNLARYLVSGVDIWLNNPRRPREASGTSGEKVPVNGGINFSVLDGWWEEGYNKKNGWTIGEAKDYANQDIQDNEDSASMYYTMEKMILPEYYDRNEDNIPEAWVQRMKESIKSVLPYYSTARMVKDYVNKLYTPAFTYSQKMTENKNEATAELVKWKKRVHKAWSGVWVTEMAPVKELLNDTQLNLSVEIQLGNLKPADVKVEVYIIKDGPNMNGPVAIEELTMQSGKTKNRYMYAANVDLPKAGSYQYGIRVRPYHKNLYKAFENRLIRWMEIE
ncbi:alpha-glucan family phosphorylase, partial [bacterium]|nr:alpha-glucan family phosphorylase [bacterium]